jgi:1-acyl-sn-glycerol-3-phosphate acyltransferase
MKVAVLGFDGPLARETRAALAQRGHTLAETEVDCALYFPGPLDELEKLVERGGFRRLVLRSHAFAYGSDEKNPGLMTEERVSLLPAGAPDQRWIEAERVARRVPNWAAVRLTNVLAPEEGDLLVRQLARHAAVPLAGRDPNVQFISLSDAVRVLVAAAESESTGLFNATGDGVIPLRKAFAAAGTTPLPLWKPLRRCLGGDASLEHLRYNCTISGERASRELGFRPELSSVQALAEFVRNKPGARPQLLKATYDDFGLDMDYLHLWGWWFAFLRRVYWRIDFEGMENIPATGRAMFVASHRGFMPMDAVMHLSLVLTHRGRVIRFLIIPSLLRIPFLCNFLTKVGGVVASQENAARLFARENLVGIFPEGIRGTFTPYRTAYQLGNFTKSAFVAMAIVNQAPIVPVAVTGHVEIFPILARINSSFITRTLGWPYFPIAPMFPLAPVPIPSKWHVRILPPVSLQGLKPQDSENTALVRDLSRHVREIIQRNIDDMLQKRKSIFWGHVLDGTAPPAPPMPGSLSPSMEEGV